MKSARMTQICLLLSMLGLMACSYKPTRSEALDDLTEEMHALVKSYAQTGTFNGNVLVMRGGQKLYEASFGYVDGQQIKQLNNKDRFGIGSIYKEFPAVAIMKLHEQKKLGLNDPLSQHVPNLPRWSEAITIKDLLQYTSGLPRVNWRKHDGITEQNVLDDLKELKALKFRPGTDYLYSNNGPILLTRIVESVTGKPFPVYLKKHLLEPAGIRGRVLEEGFPYPNRKGIAIPFDENFEEDTFSVNISNIMFTLSAMDVFRWVEALHSFKIIDESSVAYLGKTASLERSNMQAPLGTCVFENGVLVTHRHHGSSGNYEGLVTRMNRSKVTVVLLTNRKNRKLDEITTKLLEIVENL